MNEHDYLGYSNICKLCSENDVVFNNFKSNKIYNGILEHVNYELGIKYLDLLYTKFSNYINNINFDKILENDRIGNPTKYNFVEYIIKYNLKLNTTFISPTTLRYLVIGLDILYNYTKNNKNQSLDIIEIGGGYAGQCKIIYDLANIFNIVINSYTIIDLENVIKLQKKYLNIVGDYKVNFISSNNINSSILLHKYDLFISNYALGELMPISLQDLYINLVVSKSLNVYIIWNMTEINDYFKNDKFIIENEIPQTGINNVLITTNK